MSKITNFGVAHICSNNITDELPGIIIKSCWVVTRMRNSWTGITSLFIQYANSALFIPPPGPELASISW